MAASLDELVKGCSEFDNLQDCFGDKFNLLTKKGIFPYEYLDDWSKFDEKLVCLTNINFIRSLNLLDRVTKKSYFGVTNSVLMCKRYAY